MTRVFAVVSKRWKYIYWWYGGGDLQPTEELFEVDKDRYDLRNVAGGAIHKKALEEMRRIYDAYVAQFRREGVSYNDYERYKTLFDRHESWELKKPFGTAGVYHCQMRLS